MRRLMLHLIIASLTFAIGVLVSFLAQSPATVSLSINEIPKPVEFPPSPVERFCEVHRLPLKAKRIQLICGEFKGTLRGGGWGHLQVSCENPKKTRMALEDAQFHFKQSGGLNTWAWWEDYKAAKQAQFPHGYDWAYEECKSNGARCHEVEACPQCRAAEITWKRDSINRSGK